VDLLIPVDNSDHGEGPEDAAAILVEYGDFECPACAQAYPLVLQIRHHFKGDVRVVFRHFPLVEVHPFAMSAAIASEIAADHGAFWKMHDQFFSHPAPLDEHRIVAMAEAAGIGSREFRDAVAQSVHAARVRKSIEGGIRSGVRATPTFFLNGERIDTSFGLRRLYEAVGKLSTRSPGAG